MDQDRIHQLAVCQATTGLHGADLLEFELWWPTAPEEERTFFAETIDTIAMITLSEISSEEPPSHLKARVMESIQERLDEKQTTNAQSSTTTESAVPGYAFIMDSDGAWRQLPTKGTRIKELSYSKASGTAVFILEMDPGSRLPAHHHRGAEEAFVVRGDLQMRGQTLYAGDYMRAEPGTKHEDLYSEEGCRALIITSLENYPRRSIRAFDGLHRAWAKCKDAVVGSKN